MWQQHQPVEQSGRRRLIIDPKTEPIFIQRIKYFYFAILRNYYYIILCKIIDIKITIFEHFDDAEIGSLNLEKYDVVFRSPSVHPHPEINTKWDSITNYFMRNCPAKIIGVTGTKGKGTTCTMAAALLKSLGENVHVVGNIGRPAIEVLDKIKATDVVVYELSSFQLWDLQTSPYISAVLRIEPDHLDVHKDFDDYLTAKANIIKNQSANDACIYYLDNSYSVNIAKASQGQKLSYPLDISAELLAILDSLNVPGAHNRENAEAALLITYAYKNEPIDFETFRKNRSPWNNKISQSYVYWCCESWL